MIIVALKRLDSISCTIVTVSVFVYQWISLSDECDGKKARCVGELDVKMIVGHVLSRLASGRALRIRIDFRTLESLHVGNLYDVKRETNNDSVYLIRWEYLVKEHLTHRSTIIRDEKKMDK